MLCVSVSLGEEDMSFRQQFRAAGARDNEPSPVIIYCFVNCIVLLISLQMARGVLHLDHTQKMAAARHSSQARRHAQRSLQVGAGALLPTFSSQHPVLLVAQELMIQRSFTLFWDLDNVRVPARSLCSLNDHLKVCTQTRA